jgi:hypothetical protein
MGAFQLGFPGSTLSLSSGKGVNAKHAEWIDRAQAYWHIDLLSMGGYEIRKFPGEVLYKRHKEQGDVYADRSAMLTYQNLIGSAIGWYNAAMFREEWQPVFKQDAKTLDLGPDDFYTKFTANVDRTGTTFNTFLAAIFEGQLKFQHIWVLTDKPNFDASLFKNRAEQTAAGANDPYCVLYDPRSVINWDEDELGNLNWAVVWTIIVKRTFQANPVITDRWTYYDKTTFTVYESQRPEGQVAPNDNADAVTQVSTGQHALAQVGRCALRRLSIPKLFWLANRAYPQALDHLNQDNAFRHALMMACLPMPAVFGEYDEKPTASETELNVFPKDTRFEWLEPKGIAFSHAANRLAALREEIYRQFYLQAQGKDNKATASASSGYSKDMDWKPANDLLGKFAKRLRQDGENVLRDVADAKGDLQITANVSGTDFTEGDVDADIATLELADDANIPSDTLEKCLQVDLGMKLAKDQSDEVQAKIRTEIEAAPTKSQRAALQQQQATHQFAQALTKGVDRALVKPVAAEVTDSAE